MMITFILSLLCNMRAYECGQTLFCAGLGPRHHTMIINGDDLKWLHWLLCAMGCSQGVWVILVYIWEPLGETSLI